MQRPPAQLLMGKNKKGYNWRARSQLPGNVDLSQARVLEGKVLDKGDIRSQAGGYGGYEVSFIVTTPPVLAWLINTVVFRAAMPW